MSKTLDNFDKRAEAIRKLVTANAGVLPAAIEGEDDSTELKLAHVKQNILIDMKEAVTSLDAMREGTTERRPIDINIGAYIKKRYGFAITENGTPESFYAALGINPSHNTIQQLMNMPDFGEGYRWLVPEIFREAVRLGIRRAPMYTNWIAAEESVLQPNVIMPHINMSDAMPTKIGETESIPTGSVSYGDKNVKLQKIATGIKISDEVIQYVPLNLLSIYLQDVGIKTNLALDTMAIDVLINGDQANGSNAAAVIGVANTTNGFTYFDLLRAWIRMGMIGRLPQSILSNENPALEILMLDEFRKRDYMLNPQGVNLRTPVPATTAYDIHGAMPASNQIMFIDNTGALIKLNAGALRVESERIASRQISGTYVSQTTGFANLFNDARLIMDKSVAFSTAGFPAWMNPALTLSEEFQD